jgi:hypothetical protein
MAIPMDGPASLRENEDEFGLDFCGQPLEWIPGDSLIEIPGCALVPPPGV